MSDLVFLSTAVALGLLLLTLGALLGILFFPTTKVVTVTSTVVTTLYSTITNTVTTTIISVTTSLKTVEHVLTRTVVTTLWKNVTVLAMCMVQ